MKRYLFLMVLAPSLALAQTAPQQSDLDKASIMCLSHRHTESDNGSRKTTKFVYDTDWEHCLELFDLKIKQDKEKEANDIGLTKRVLEQLKGK